jgi:outer membrane protein assembly factor BamB
LASFLRNKTNILGLVLSLVILGLMVVGCAGPTFQGWSGFAEDKDILYFGGVDGRVFAISPMTRSQNSAFPSQGEWVFSVPSTGAPGSICGPACAPSSPRASIYATPAIVDDLVCVGIYSGDTGRVVAMNKIAPGYTDGVPQRSKGEWTYPSGVKSFGAIVGSPVVVDNTVYVGTSDGNLYAIDAVYGEKKWQFNTGGKIWTSPVVFNGVVYVSNYQKKLFALSGTDGSQIWSIELTANIASSPAVSTDSIFVGTFDNHLYAIDRATGKERWNFNGGNWFWSTPVYKGDIVYAGCLDHKIYAINVETGKEVWRFAADGPIASTPTLTDKYLVIASERGAIYVLDPVSGSLVRSVDLGFPVMAPLLVDGDVVYVHAGSLCVYAVNLETGQKIWEFCYSANK